MKLAVIGSGPLALYAAAHFYRLGAHVVLFQRSPLGGNARFCFKNNLKIDVDYPVAKSVEKFWDEDIVPLIEFVEEQKLTKAGDVLRVHKRFLHQKEVIANRSRMLDLFRVIFSVNPKDSILKQVAENPELFKQLGENVLTSLHEPVESFEDFDIVIEATGRGKTDFKMGPAGTYALNEKNLVKHSHFYYGKDFFTNFNKTDVMTAMIVGDDLGAFLAIENLSDWLDENEKHKIIWVNHDRVQNHSRLKNILKKSNAEFESKKVKFEEDLRAWRDLEDYMKAKVSMPVEPVERIKFYEGYNITSIDKLLDRTGVFVTIESPDFRESSNVKADLKTIPVDAVIVQYGVDVKENLGVQLEIEEPGYYILQSDSIKEGLIKILEIEKSILNYFSKSDQ